MVESHRLKALEARLEAVEGRLEEIAAEFERLKDRFEDIGEVRDARRRVEEAFTILAIPRMCEDWRKANASTPDTEPWQREIRAYDDSLLSDDALAHLREWWTRNQPPD
ncbi:MAG TPA: hypothetical protein VEJ86_04230 [Candidatus Binataceae bacterium]|nr:hypothetical protein [Candidatus Binataceae bacterium]